MLRVPEGVFVRGNDKGLPDEQPEHSVTIDEFYIDQYEVTNRHYDLCVRAGSCRLPQLSRSLANGLYYADPVFHNFPVIWITWDDADYCAYVGKRLPTEAESGEGCAWNGIPALSMEQRAASRSGQLRVCHRRSGSDR